ncbi:hypothetical protein COU54_01390 [Candidatus Pacearchaeota archaeon CG10_big_fil_rev_8_21_14_0_10_31_24]|nr:MAG: hypothetical protein COU54_01390 [Candidatus Pacearchaeota archaeon CG10_big_fil_rev_8_21_14_0_10_31_24]
MTQHGDDDKYYHHKHDFDGDNCQLYQVSLLFPDIDMNMPPICFVSFDDIKPMSAQIYNEEFIPCKRYVLHWSLKKILVSTNYNLNLNFRDSLYFEKLCDFIWLDTHKLWKYLRRVYQKRLKPILWAPIYYKYLWHPLMP